MNTTEELDRRMRAFQRSVATTRECMRDQLDAVDDPAATLAVADSALIAAMFAWTGSRIAECGYDRDEAKRRLIEYVNETAALFGPEKLN